MERSGGKALSARRYIALFLALALVFLLYGVRLFELQIIHGESYAAMRESRSVSTSSVAASRGEIVDRYMKPLVYNTAGYAMVFDANYFGLGRDEASQMAVNDRILRLTALLSANGETWNDTLPIEKTAPFDFVEGEETAVATLKSKLSLQSYATAENCRQALIDRYCLVGYSAADARTVAGVRYEMETREFSAANPYTFAGNVSREITYVIMEKADEFPGVTVSTVSVRNYADGTVAPHVIGYVGRISADEYKAKKSSGYSFNDIIGKSGAESAFESELRGIDGVKTITRNSSGTVISEEITTLPQAGNTVVLTLDTTLQRSAQNALDEVITDLKKLPAAKGNGHDVKSGSVVVLDVKTGGVLVSASWPTFDLSTYAADIADLLNDEGRPLFNRAISGSFVVGSTVKPGVALAAITNGTLSPSTRIQCNRIYTYYDDFQPKCLGTHGSLNVVSALSKSCNVFFYEVGRLLGGETLCRYYSLYSFGSKTGLEDGFGESAGILRTPENYVSADGVGWTPGTTLQNAIGQVSQITPMQLAAYAMMIANDGVRYQTHFLHSIRSYDGLTETLYEPQVAARVTWSDTARATVKAGMLECVKTGTAAKYFGGISYTVAAKTGTAQTGVSSWSDHGCFIGYAPADNPEIAIAVIVERGKSAAAATVARQVLDTYFSEKSTINKPDGIGVLLP